MFFLASSLRDREDHRALDVPMCGSFVCFLSVCKRERAVDGDVKETRIEQAADFLQLCTVRLDLRCRDRNAQLRSLSGAGDA